MAHGITARDSLMSVRTTPWHGLGVVLDQTPRSLDEALEAAGLTWSVAKQPLHRPDGRIIDGFTATVREDTDAILGVVSDDYVVVQNRDCFAFLANLLGSELVFETAGSLWGGKQVFITAKAARPHHGRRRRGAPLRRAVGLAHGHRRDPRDDHAGARGVRQHGPRRPGARALGLPRAPRRRPHPAAARGARRARPHGGLLPPVQGPRRSAGARADERARARRDPRRALPTRHRAGRARPSRACARARHRGCAVVRGDAVGNAPGSKWCAWNAIAEFHDHHGRPRTPEGGFVRKLEDPRGIKARALELITAA
jgi:hypothetical protein